jgi:hypothetical protein
MMRKIVLFLILAVGLSVGCGSAEEKPSASANASNQPAVNSTDAANQQAAVGPQNSAKRTIVDVDKDSITSEPPPGAKNYEQQAPEDSTYTSSLGTTALEVRTFKKHPQIARVEKTIDGKNQTVKVFLKNGKVIDIEPEKLPNIATVGSAAILDAAGLKSAQISPPSSAKKGDGTKKGETNP